MTPSTQEATPAAGNEPTAAPTTSATASAAPLAATSPDPAPVAAPSEPPGTSAPSTPPVADAKAKAGHKEAHQAEPQPTAAEAYDGPDPCQGKSHPIAAIGGACKKGGRKAVKDIMKGVVKKAKAAGQNTQCMSCHTDTSSFQLLPNAVSDLKKWL
jgi:hypothetical protein